MLLALGMLVIIGVAIVVLEPLVRGSTASLERTNDEMSEAEATRRVRLLALRDAEYDYQMGKLNEVDYLELRAELQAEALEAMKAVEAEKNGGPGAADAGTREMIEAEIAAVRAGLRTGTTCTGCGHGNPPGSRFCASCGEALHLSGSPSA
ncbi:MAG TPA: hypothetical protein VJ925_06280 [Longimicrobiales bacterium]|nr:hypothetical protein [Longimicrobiales bacterium]